jgi:MraZ protein
VVLAKGFEPNIDVYPLDAWSENVARVADLDSFSPEARRMKRYVFAGALVTELDAQGRVLIPQKLAEHAGLGRDVVVAGVHDHLEIWDRTQWDAERSSTEGSVSDVAERIADRRG